MNKYEIGECFSNGLYLEKIVDKEYDQYVMIGMINDKWIMLDKNSESIIGRMYTKVNCPKNMQESPYKKVGK